MSKLKFSEDKPVVVKMPFNAFADLDEESENDEVSEENKIIDYVVQFHERFDEIIDELLKEESSL